MRYIWLFTCLTVWCTCAPLASCRALFGFVEQALSLSREDCGVKKVRGVLEQPAKVKDGDKLRHAEKSNTPQTKFTLWASNDNEAGIASGTCPFSRPFPSYKIDLSTVDLSGEEGGSFGWPWQRASVRNQLERLTQKQIETGVSKELVWKEKVDGPAALAVLWRNAQQLLERKVSNSSIICALPDAQRKTVRQWVDLMKWLLSSELFPTSRLLSCTYQLVKTVPTVTLKMSELPLPQPTNEGNNVATANYDHAIVTARTKSWVKRVLVQLGICPFTKSTTMSGQGLSDVGVPVGSIAYHTSFASSLSAAGLCELMADTWDAITAMLMAGPEGKKGVSSILLAAPEFDDDFNLWSGPVFALLEAGVLAAQATKDIGVVCFHPLYATPDGSSFPGFGHMHSVPRLEKWMISYRAEQLAAVEKRRRALRESNAVLENQIDLSNAVCPVLNKDEIAAGGAWQRRTPHATINVLRANQLEAAEGRRSTPKLYAENILKLVAVVGCDKLQEELERERNMGL